MMLRNMRSGHTRRIQGRRACARVAHRPPAWWLVVVGTSDRGSSGVDTDMVCRPIRSVSLTWELNMYTSSMSCEFKLTVTPPPPVVCVAVHGSPCGSPGTMLWAASRPSVGGPNVERRVHYGTVIVRPYPYAAGIGGAAAGGGVKQVFFYDLTPTVTRDSRGGKGLRFISEIY